MKAMMGLRLRAGLFGLLLGAVLAHPLAAHADEPGRDHPAVPRYPGAEMRHYDYKEFEESQLILSQPRLVAGKWVADKLLPVEGAVTYANYEIPGSASAFQVMRNYQSALQRSGFKELFVCKRPCIDSNVGDLGPLLKARSLYLNYSEDNQYLAAQREGTYVSLITVSTGNGPSAKTLVFVFVTDQGRLDANKIAVQGNSPIARALASEGRVDLYGFYFDTGKAQLQAGSEKTLKELAQVLQDNPGLRVRLVGHTDNQGGADANLALSEARARAVASALTQQAGLGAERVEAQGQGASQPVAPNTSEDGRARNRRVEVVALSSPGAAQPATQARTGGPSGNAQPPATAPRKEGVTVDEAVRKTQNATDTTSRAVDTVRALKGLFGR